MATDEIPSLGGILPADRTPSNKNAKHPSPPAAVPANTTGGEPPSESRSSLHYSLLGPSLLKAGQEGVDQTRVSEIIYNASKGSKFFSHEKKRDEQLTERIETLLKRKVELESGGLAGEIRKADEQIALLESSRDLSQIIVHVDCDAFYASVEELDRPELKNVPMAVGGGVLSTCNYTARQFGVRSGMAGHIAKKICPQLVFVKHNFEKYGAKAEEIRAILKLYDPRFESASMDEAYLNLTQVCPPHPSYTPETLVEHIRASVLETTKISISAGIAPNAKIAKIASNKNKPNGQFRIPNTRADVMSFMSTLPVRKVNGVGRVFERELEACDIKTCGDIYTHRGLLRPLFGDKACTFLLNCYCGIGRTVIRPASEYERKSVGTESTFRDLFGAEKLREKLRHTAEELEKDLVRTRLAGRVLVLKVKLHTYEVYTRQRNLGRLVHGKEELYNLALPLLTGLEAEFPGLKLRLMGLRVTGLASIKDGKGKTVDMQKWLTSNAPAQPPHPPPSPKKRKQDSSTADADADEWEVWPEEEFERAQQAEEEEGMQLTQELSDELDAASATNPVPLPATLPFPAPELDPETEPMSWQCPICATLQPADNTLFNQHVDFCLSKEAIRSAVKEASAAQTPVLGGDAHSRKRRRLGFATGQKR
ncbi:putative DNA-directed polymerase kappa [Tricharina praecox]|uniref:putative DNA-directed polymerase kappa n=1 Tax=Tricharina praecox TaxID=43433 RepID=UPI00221FE70A|nr:putative DNA-directed polymerase kappa [Tricharina praecox]KAI5858392.1 putative DNA-directed polymerase kappa [Tricharina praecox]